MDINDQKPFGSIPGEPNPEQTPSGQSTGTQAGQIQPDGTYAFRGYAGEGVYHQPAQPQSEAAPAQPEQKKKTPFWKRLTAFAAAVALVAAACAVTAGVTERTWQERLQTMSQNFEEKLNVLQEQLDGKVNNLGSNGPISVPSEGLTPAQLYQQNLRSVVAISCTSISGNYTSTSAGSGFILTEDGYVVTNHHVIEGADKILVVTSDNVEYTAQLIGADAFNDIALLKIKAQGLQAAKIGDSDALAVGSQVVAIGNALGELTATLTVGYISGKDRDVTTDGNTINMLQTDTAINPGNSGGPLFNMKGEVVGITTAKYSGSTASGASIEGIGFAIPINDVIGMLEDLRDYGYITGVQLGVMVRNVDPNVANTYGFPIGVYVDSVVDGSCAQKAGIRGKDILLEVGGYEIGTMNDLTRALRKFKAGQSATVKVWRGGQEVLLDIVFDAKAQS